MQNGIKAVETALFGNSIKQLEEARTICSAALKTNPNDVLHLSAMGIIDYRTGHPVQASKWFEKALVIQPNSAKLHYDYAKALVQQKRYNEALLAFKQCIQIKPDFAEAHYRIGNIYLKSGDNNQAGKAFCNALSIKPNFTEALENLGLALINKGDLAEAQNFYPQVLATNRNNPRIVNDYGMLLYYQGEFKDSIHMFERALSLKPDYLDALSNIGVALRSSGQLQKAISILEQVIARKRHEHEADYHKNLGMMLLADGQFKRGWREFEWRLKLPQMAAHLQQGMVKPRWNGEVIKDAILLIRAEQGLGDTLQFCRYALCVAALGLRVIMEVQPGLARLIQSLKGIEQVITVGDDLPDHDFYCSMMSLPKIFNTSMKTIPSNIPYLSVTDEILEYWQKRLPDDSSRFLKVGMVWAGNPRLHSTALAAADRRRSISPELLVPLKDIDGIQFYSLQKDGSPPPKDLNMITLIDDCHDFADTAALAANLDLIISVDTSVVHLAGALGKPVWVLNRFDSCWRWMYNRDDSPWYPTLRLFRQTTSGDWKNVVLRIKDALKQRVSSRK
jgi:Tfp pilus assembly protein PilF